MKRIFQQTEKARDPTVREERLNRRWALHDTPLQIRRGKIQIRD